MQVTVTSAALAAHERHRNPADRDPVFSVHTFDNHAAAARALSVIASIPTSFHRLLSFVLTAFFICTQVRPMIGFLVVFSDDVPHVVTDLFHWVSHFLFHHEWGVF